MSLSLKLPSSQERLWEKLKLRPQCYLVTQRPWGPRWPPRPKVSPSSHGYLVTQRPGGPRWPPPPKVSPSSQGVSLLPWSCSHPPVFAQSWKPTAGVFQTVLCSPLPGYWGVDLSWLGQEKRQGKEEGVSLLGPSTGFSWNTPILFVCFTYRTSD